MSHFLRLLAEDNKSQALANICTQLRSGTPDIRHFELSPDLFSGLPNTPFAYWVSREVMDIFRRIRNYESLGYNAVNGLTTGDDFRFVRVHWEVSATHRLVDNSTLDNGTWRWVTYAKGGEDSPFYCRFPTVLNWHKHGYEMKAFSGTIVRSEQYYMKCGLTWPLRARRFGPQCRPFLSVFSVRGYSAVIPEERIFSVLGLCNSAAFDYLFKVCLGRYAFPEFVVGTLKQMPVPDLSHFDDKLRSLARDAWSLKRTLDTVDEISHAFLLPITLRNRVPGYDPDTTAESLQRIQEEIDAIAFSLYGFSESDCAAAHSSSGAAAAQGEEDYQPSGDDDENEDEEVDGDSAIDQSTGLLSWSAGVAFGRFDWRLATGERIAPPEPDPFDPLPAKSPGMLPDGAEPFHSHDGILVDDPDHKHDLARLIEEVLTHVDAPVPLDVRRWLQRELFPFHLQRYSKSRRKAPIYWPLANVSGGYTLWLYYPELTSQTLYTAIHEFIEPKLEQLGKQATVLRNKGSARSRDDDKALESLQTLEKELVELRATILQIAPTYRPNHDDGVQITAAPLWPLFRHKPWQKLLKETWSKLEKGDYDWAHLAMAYWPDRVHEKCKTDKSLAIAHDLEDLYIEPEQKPAGTRGRKRASP